MKHPNSLKIGIFCAFIMFSIFIGSYWTFYPPMPTRVGNDPYNVSLKSLVDNARMLEGQEVVITSTARLVHWNASADVMTFHVHDDYFGITVPVMIENWTSSNVYPVSQVTNGSTVVIRGTCYLQSKGYIAGIELHVLLPDLVYLISITGLVAIIVLLFHYFKVDFKKLVITRKKQDSPEGTT
ncbi:MAG TPA: hypothetical protein VKM55_12100 [Candidatus Lokiarchaeia archaeon]|nr:hypothetical protein [Candidatus Lokiarchaeia archaeon]